jgi:hypothetical protein
MKASEHRRSFPRLTEEATIWQHLSLQASIKTLNHSQYFSQDCWIKASNASPPTRPILMP